MRSNASLVSYDQLLGVKRFSPGKHQVGEKDIKMAQLVAANEQLKKRVKQLSAALETSLKHRHVT